MCPLLRHIWVAVKHKAFVFCAGLRTRTPLRLLIIHDWSKFTPAEAPHYARNFYGDKADPAGFAKAWAHHLGVNPHHWEYWVDEYGEPHLMPERYVREMVADWLGASRAYEGRWPASSVEWPWLQKNFQKINLHPETRMRVRRMLREVFGE